MTPDQPAAPNGEFTSAQAGQYATESQCMPASFLRDAMEGVEGGQAIDPEPQDDEGAESSGSEVFVECRTDLSEAARDIVRLFQCQICSLPFTDAVTLPCGRSICRACLPQAHARPSITYPAVLDRRQGFQCPFSDCEREHAVADCNVDVVLSKVGSHMSEHMERRMDEAQGMKISTQIIMLDPWSVAGISTLKDHPDSQRVLGGGKLVSTWTLAKAGDLKCDVEVSYRALPASGDVDPATSLDIISLEKEILQSIQEATRTEMDCQVCYALFYEPLTTSCGHTFCRACLHRVLDHSQYCPVCRRRLGLNPLLDRESCPPNRVITSIIQTFWEDELAARREAHDLEQTASRQLLNTPLFVCTLAFPQMPTFLHVFEPRYRLMIRRALEGDRTFGIVLPKRQSNHDDCYFHELGTLLRIVNVQYYADGRCLIETVGLTRFKVVQHGLRDGYTVSRTERVDDISMEEEEAMEAAEVLQRSTVQQMDEDDEGNQADDEDEEDCAVGAKPSSDSAEHEGNGDTPARPIDTEHMSTEDLMRYAKSFVTRMRDQSVPWLTERIFRIYGVCPDDPAIFPWWFASILPVRDLEKYRLLGTSSVRQRLQICCRWIVEWETSRW